MAEREDEPGTKRPRRLHSAPTHADGTSATTEQEPAPLPRPQQQRQANLSEHEAKSSAKAEGKQNAAATLSERERKAAAKQARKGGYERYLDLAKMNDEDRAAHEAEEAAAAEQPMTEEDARQQAVAYGGLAVATHATSSGSPPSRPSGVSEAVRMANGERCEQAMEHLRAASGDNAELYDRLAMQLLADEAAHPLSPTRDAAQVAAYHAEHEERLGRSLDQALAIADAHTMHQAALRMLATKIHGMNGDALPAVQTAAATFNNFPWLKASLIRMVLSRVAAGELFQSAWPACLAHAVSEAVSLGSSGARYIVSSPLHTLRDDVPHSRE